MMSAQTDILVSDRLEGGGFGVVTPFQGNVRLSAATRELAARYLSGEVGRTMQEADFAVSAEFLATNPTPNRLVAEAVRLMAERAPLRYLVQRSHSA